MELTSAQKEEIQTLVDNLNIFNDAVQQGADPGTYLDNMSDTAHEIICCVSDILLEEE